MAVEADGAVIGGEQFPGRQGRVLFACLALEHGQPVPRDQLATALWGERPPATWDKALSVLVSKLRSLLGGVGVDGAGVLTGAFGCYRLELPEGCWVDVIAAAAAVSDAERALKARDARAARAVAATAESLTRTPFLPGDNGTWVEDRRRDLADVRRRALIALADSCLRLGDGHEAPSWAEQAIELEPFREEGYRLLMRAHNAAGNRAEALRVYERCRRLIADELGAFPSPETEALHHELLQEAPPPPDPAPTVGPDPPGRSRRIRRDARGHDVGSDQRRRIGPDSATGTAMGHGGGGGRRGRRDGRGRRGGPRRRGRTCSGGREHGRGARPVRLGGSVGACRCPTGGDGLGRRVVVGREP